MNKNQDLKNYLSFSFFMIFAVLTAWLPSVLKYHEFMWIMPLTSSLMGWLACYNVWYTKSFRFSKDIQFFKNEGFGDSFSAFMAYAFITTVLLAVVGAFVAVGRNDMKLFMSFSDLLMLGFAGIIGSGIALFLKVVSGADFKRDHGPLSVI